MPALHESDVEEAALAWISDGTLARIGTFTAGRAWFKLLRTNQGSGGAAA